MSDGRKIVVIEDDEAIRGLVTTFLKTGGHTVVATGDPLGAKELVRQEAPDLVLCDIAMPELDGYGVLRALQTDPETARYPVVFLTAHREFTERGRPSVSASWTTSRSRSRDAAAARRAVVPG